MEKIISKTIKVRHCQINLPELELFKGKFVEIIIKEKTKKKRHKLQNFFNLAGKIAIDNTEIERLRENSKI